MADTPCHPVPRQLNEALLQPACASGMAKLRQQKQSSMMEEYYTSNPVYVVYNIYDRTLYKTTLNLGLHLDSCGSSYQKTEAQSQSTVSLHWDSSILETTLLTLGQEARKTPKKTPVWSRLVGTRTPQIQNEGDSCHYRRLKEGLVHWNSLVSSFHVKSIKFFKMHNLWPFFVQFLCFWWRHGLPRRYKIAHVSSFQSLLRTYVVYHISVCLTTYGTADPTKYACVHTGTRVWKYVRMLEHTCTVHASSYTKI